MGLRRDENEDILGMTFTLQKFEGRYAVLKSDDPEIGFIKWPIKKLQDNAKEGDRIAIKVKDTEEQYDLKRRLLEELVN